MAGRIPDSFIQDLLARTDIVQVIGERLQLKKAGKEYVALSPFTNEKSPSFTVSPQKQFYHCFSSGKHGSAITFLMEYDRLPFVEAVEELAKRAGLTVPREGGASEKLVLDGPLDALAAAERHFKAELKGSNTAIEYLKKRGVTGETAKRFGIGFAPDSWDSLAKQFPDPRFALEAGLLIKKDGGGGVYDRFRNRVMFPIRDTRGRVIGFGGRTLGDDKAKYLNSPETPLFHKGRNLYGLFEARQGTGAIPYLLVVEGYMDAVMLAQHDIPHVVATLGTATTREHLNLLFKSTQRVVFCFDGDRAGRAAAWRALEQALPEAYEGREMLFMFLPDGHDPDTLVQEIGADEFRRRVTAAQSLSGFLLGELSSQVNLATADGRARLVSLARPHLARLREGPLRTLILDELARRSRMTHAGIQSSAPLGQSFDTPDSLDGVIARPVQRALRALLEAPELASSVSDPELVAESSLPGVGVLLGALQFFQERPDATAAQFVETKRETADGEALGRVATLQFDARINPRNEFGGAINDLIIMGLQTRHEALIAAINTRELTPAEQQSLLALKRQIAEHTNLGRQLARTKSV